MSHPTGGLAGPYIAAAFCSYTKQAGSGLPVVKPGRLGRVAFGAVHAYVYVACIYAYARAVHVHVLASTMSIYVLSKHL